jgi:hypothetical protein
VATPPFRHNRILRITLSGVRLGLTISGNQTIAAIAAMPGSDQ